MDHESAKERNREQLDSQPGRRETARSNHENSCLSLVFCRNPDRRPCSGPPWRLARGNRHGNISPIAAVEDRNGVIAPWYRGHNGQCDFRIRIAAETLKRYPWADAPPAVMPAPHFVFNGHWGIQPDGTILLKPKLNDWDNGDVGQRSASLLHGLDGLLPLYGRSGGHRAGHA